MNANDIAKAFESDEEEDDEFFRFSSDSDSDDDEDVREEEQQTRTKTVPHVIPVEQEQVVKQEQVDGDDRLG
jgi:hypothetical protein